MRKHGPEVGDSTLEPLASLAELFKLLSDKTRLRILMILAKGERNVSSLCDELRLPQPTVSHHLGLLRLENVITNRRHGKQVFYGLDGHVQAGEGTIQIDIERFHIRIGAREGQLPG